MTDRPEWMADEFVALAEQAARVVEADRAAAWARIRQNYDAIAGHLTETLLPADLRAAGIRVVWEEQR
jgi:hypothetical protein